MREIRLLPAAAEEIDHAVARYAEESQELAADLYAEVLHALGSAAAFPDRGSPHLRGTRRILLRRFRYSLIYAPREDPVTVVAFAHFRQRPGYWRSRLR